MGEPVSFFAGVVFCCWPCIEFGLVGLLASLEFCRSVVTGVIEVEGTESTPMIFPVTRELSPIETELHEMTVVELVVQTLLLLLLVLFMVDDGAEVIMRDDKLLGLVIVLVAVVIMIEVALLVGTTTRGLLPLVPMRRFGVAELALVGSKVLVFGLRQPCTPEDLRSKSEWFF